MYIYKVTAGKSLPVHATGLLLTAPLSMPNLQVQRAPSFNYIRRSVRMPSATQLLEEEASKNRSDECCQGYVRLL